MTPFDWLVVLWWVAVTVFVVGLVFVVHESRRQL
jgi:hypothetical protein